MGDESSAGTIEPQTMGRPKKQTPTVSMRIDEDAHDLARQACSFTKESIVDYVSRVVRERAEADVHEAAEKVVKKKAKGGKADS